MNSTLTKCACIVSLLILVALVGWSCAANNRPPMTAKNENLFSLTNVTIDGKLQQMLVGHFGLVIAPTRNDVTVNFGTNNWYINVLFNEKTVKPESILLKTTGPDGRRQSIFDANADGIPDIRMIEGETNRQLFFEGKWYSYEVSGTNNIIIYKGKPVPFYFDKSGWHQNTNRVSKPENSQDQETAQN